MSERSLIFERLTDWVLSYSAAVRLAVDGPDAAGKTTLAGHLAVSISHRGRPVVSASLDGFHRPARERYRRGELSPEGYFFDSFDYPRLRSQLLEPLGPAGSRIYRTAVFDYLADLPVETAGLTAPDNAVLVFDGVFLLRPELVSFWDLVVFLDVGEEEVLRRAMLRDSARLRGSEIRERYARRYLPAQRIYRKTVQPLERADVVIDNTNPAHPRLVKAPWH